MRAPLSRSHSAAAEVKNSICSAGLTRLAFWLMTDFRRTSYVGPRVGWESQLLELIGYCMSFSADFYMTFRGTMATPNLPNCNFPPFFLYNLVILIDKIPPRLMTVMSASGSSIYSDIPEASRSPSPSPSYATGSSIRTDPSRTPSLYSYSSSLDGAEMLREADGRKFNNQTDVYYLPAGASFISSLPPMSATLIPSVVFQTKWNSTDCRS